MTAALKKTKQFHRLIIKKNNIVPLPVNRFFPLRSYADEGPLLDGLVSGSGVVTATVVVVVVAVVVVVTGGCVVVSSGERARCS